MQAIKTLKRWYLHAEVFAIMLFLAWFLTLVIKNG